MLPSNRRSNSKSATLDAPNHGALTELIGEADKFTGMVGENGPLPTIDGTTRHKTSSEQMNLTPSSQII